MNFEIGPRVTCELAVLTDTRLLAVANSGAGKSWLLRRILEQTAGAIQHLVIDPEGEFASLRERFDYVLAAKQGSDTIADPRFAKLLAERLLELGASAILDIYELKAHERVRFVKLFLDALINAPKRLWHPALVVVDEAHVYCPQQGQAESADAVIDLATRGRKRGFCAVLATQRLSKLHKDAAAECNNKLIGRCALDVDMKRASEELGFSGREEQHRLRLLAPGEFFAFGPALTSTVTRVMVGGVETRHPKAGSRIAGIVPPPTERIRGLLPQLSDLPSEAEEEQRTLEGLRRDLARVRRELTLARKEHGPPDEAMIERRVAVAIVAKERELGAKSVGMEKRVALLERVLGAAADELVGVAERLRKTTNGGIPHEQAPGSPQRSGSSDLRSREGSSLAKSGRYDDQAHARAETARRSGRTDRISDGTAGNDLALSRSQQRILDTLAGLEALGIDAPHKSVVAVFAGISPTSGGYFNNLSALRSEGLLDYPQPSAATLTDAGREQAAPSEAPATLAGLHDAWCRRISKSQAVILRAVIAIYPDDIAKTELAEDIAVSPMSGGFFNNLGRLRSLGAIDYPAPTRVVATRLLFPEGLL